MRFTDRRQAGRDLARELTELVEDDDPVVLALPRGGVPVGFEVAKALHAPLDVFVVRKLGLPDVPEVAMGAIASGGVSVFNDVVLRQHEIDDEALMRVARREEAELRRREKAYRDGADFPDIAGRTVIVVDDGLATGASMRAALQALRLLDPKRLIAAVPVALTVDDNRLADADLTVCLFRPARFHSVGQAYTDFDQVGDDEVRDLLMRARTFPVPRLGHDPDLEVLRGQAQIIKDPATDYGPLLARCAGKRFVLIGEASHGTQDFYRHRAELTQRLIADHGFHAVAVEADWPDAWRVNAFVRGEGAVHNAEHALDGFERFPVWMWRNTEVLRFVRWLKAHNDAAPVKAGFYGLDLYSLNRSIEVIIDYLDRIDPEAARRARQRYGCFGRYENDPQTYGYATERLLGPDCRREIVAQLNDLRRLDIEALPKDGRMAEDARFCAEQNARLVANAERYYRAMFAGRPSSWNIRDSHMCDTLEALAGHIAARGDAPAKIVVWAHNSHIGDARATDQGRRGEHNIGQLVRERHPRDTLLIGFSTYDGTVTAADDWDAPTRTKRLNPALPDSIEHLLHRVGPRNFCLDLSSDAVRGILTRPRLQRFVGVIYRPDTERLSHYYPASLAGEFDAIIHLDRTTAVTPLAEDRIPAREPAETYPSGL